MPLLTGNNSITKETDYFAETFSLSAILSFLFCGKYQNIRLQ